MGKVKVPKKLLWKAIRLKCLDCEAGSYKEVRATLNSLEKFVPRSDGGCRTNRDPCHRSGVRDT